MMWSLVLLMLTFLEQIELVLILVEEEECYWPSEITWNADVL